MSANATRGDFARHYIFEPRPRVLGARLPMIAMIVVLLAALAATVLPGQVADAGQDDMSVVLTGP